MDIDPETLARRQSNAAQFRPHCQVFSRMGWALLSIFAADLVFQIAAIPLLHLVPSWANNPLFYWCLAMVSTYGTGFPLFCLILRPVPPVRPETQKPVGPLRLGQVYLISVAVLYLTNLLTLAALSLVGVMRGKPVSNPVDQILDFPLALNFLLACVAAPIFEELMFRKLLLDRLRPYGDAFAVLVSALAFGLLHGNFSQYFYAFTLGCVFGYLVLRTGCVWQSILLHALVNLISAGLIPLIDQLGETGTAVFGSVILGAILLGCVFFCTLRREIHLHPGPIPLSTGRKWKLLFTSPGFLFFSLASLLQSVFVLIEL